MESKNDSNFKYINREISWLSFNERVLQEASDGMTPLIERLRFLGIFSNNRDEFFRVRVATLKRLSDLAKRKPAILKDDQNPKLILKRINETVVAQEKQFQKLYASILMHLRGENIYIIDESQLEDLQQVYVKRYFQDFVRPVIIPILLSPRIPFPFLKDRSIYLAVTLHLKEDKAKRFALIEIPSDKLSRFVEIPSEDDRKFIVLLDNVIRHNLTEIFAYFDCEKIESHTVKITRDAELDLVDDFSQSFMEKMKKGLKSRKKASPTRVVYDGEMPEELLEYILENLRAKNSENVIASGRYHNFKDFIGFPDLGRKDLCFDTKKPLPHPEFKESNTYLSTLLRKDVLLYYPFQSFRPATEILREAAMHPEVLEIKINLYRVARRSLIVNALINAAKNGKKVTAIVELRARFDEEANIHWANELQEGGVQVIFGITGLKVHSKLMYIEMRKGTKKVHIVHIGTGNFNEKTAGLYTDYSLFTSNPKICAEVYKVFDFFQNPYKTKSYKHLVVSPFNTREHFLEMIEKEIVMAKKGKKGRIILKLNSLMDRVMIEKLYKASCQGVKIDLIIRGICSLIPGVKGMSENIRAISILDRFLEHARVLYFYHGGEEKVYLSSADWMPRNLDHRVEISVPILDKNLTQQIKDVLEIQLKDNTKARVLDGDLSNQYVEQLHSEPHRSQYETYDYYYRMQETPM